MAKQVSLSNKIVAKLDLLKGSMSYSELIGKFLPPTRSELMRIAASTQEQLFSLFKYNKQVPLTPEIIDSILEYILEVNSLTLMGNLEQIREGTVKFADDLAKMTSKLKEGA